MESTVSRRLVLLSAEHFACFQAMREDIETVSADREPALEIVSALAMALSSGDAIQWRVFVRALDEFIAPARNRNRSASAHRLAQFVRENADLLVGV